MEDAEQRRLQDRARARLAQQVVAYAYDVPLEELAASTRRSAKVAFARQVAMYLAHVAFELSLSRVGLAFGRDRTTAAHACHRVEDARDEPELDARLDALENLLREATALEPEPLTLGV